MFRRAECGAVNTKLLINCGNSQWDSECCCLEAQGGKYLSKIRPIDWTLSGVWIALNLWLDGGSMSNLDLEDAAVSCCVLPKRTVFHITLWQDFHSWRGPGCVQLPARSCMASSSGLQPNEDEFAWCVRSDTWKIILSAFEKCANHTFLINDYCLETVSKLRRIEKIRTIKILYSKNMLMFPLKCILKLFFKPEIGRSLSVIAKG